MMKKAFPLVVVAVLLVVFALWWRMGTQPQVPITTFEECVAAGYPVMESYPRQCRDGNNTFVENIGTTPPPVACTMEAKLCPDGSAVGRTGPKCEFAECPTSPIGRQCSGPSDTTCPANFECIQACGPPVVRYPDDTPPEYFC